MLLLVFCFTYSVYYVVYFDNVILVFIPLEFSFVFSCGFGSWDSVTVSESLAHETRQINACPISGYVLVPLLFYFRLVLKLCEVEVDTVLVLC